MCSLWMAGEGGEAVSHHATVDVAEAVSFVERGGMLTKLGVMGRQYRRHFFIDLDMMALCQAQSKHGDNNNPDHLRIWVLVRNIADVVKVEKKQGPSRFTLGLTTHNKPKTLIAPSREVSNCETVYLMYKRTIRRPD